MTRSLLSPLGPHSRVNKLEAAKAEQILCAHCNAHFKLGDAGFVQGYYYSELRTPVAEKHWYKCEINTCSLRCPECSALNYIFNHPQFHLIISLIKHLGFSLEELFQSRFDQKGDLIIPVGAPICSDKTTS